MITNKDRENAVSMTKIWIRDSEGNQLEDIAGIISRIRAESAEQARKEADEKLAIAVKALEEINHKRDDQPDCNLSVDYLDAWDISDRALKEIQG